MSCTSPPAPPPQGGKEMLHPSFLQGRRSLWTEEPGPVLPVLGGQSCGDPLGDRGPRGRSGGTASPLLPPPISPASWRGLSPHSAPDEYPAAPPAWLVLLGREVGAARSPAPRCSWLPSLRAPWAPLGTWSEAPWGSGCLLGRGPRPPAGVPGRTAGDEWPSRRVTAERQAPARAPACGAS